MIDQMVATLHQEGEVERAKKEYCKAELDKTEDAKAEAQRRLDTAEERKTEFKTRLDGLALEVQSIAAALETLDKSVADAKAQRTKEKTQFEQTRAELTAAMTLLSRAQEMLKQVYLKVAQSEARGEDTEMVQMLGLSRPTAFIQTQGTHSAGRPEEKRAGAGMGIVNVMELLKSDLKKDLSLLEKTESDAVGDFNKLQEDAKLSRETKVKERSDLQVTIARTSEEMAAVTAAKEAAATDINAAAEALKALHAECDELLSTFEKRLKNRAEELEGLKNSKAVLAGADYE
jgi:chromosome segregation ATPase